MGVVHVPEGRRILRGLTVRENLELGAFSVKRAHVRQERMKEVFRLFPVLDRLQHQDGSLLSGGEQQMLALGRALMHGPRVLLLDEPSMGLAPKLVLDTMRIVKRLNEEEGTRGNPMVENWHGVMPALMTEMKQDGTLDLESTARHIDSCIKAGCTGFIMLGTLGENSSLSADEKESVIRCAVETVGGKVPVLAGNAEYTTEFAIDSAKRAERAGASGLMALPCMVYEQDPREALTHFRTVARSTDLPIMIYNNRVSYKVDPSPDDFAELASERNIVAVKESSHDSRRITDMINRIGDRYRVFCGVDDLLLENVLFGAVGWVSGMANCFPRESVELFRLAEAKKVDEAV